MKWEPVVETENPALPVERCPICKGDKLEVETDDNDIVRKERCAAGCYVYDFDLGKRVK